MLASTQGPLISSRTILYMHATDALRLFFAAYCHGQPVDRVKPAPCSMAWSRAQLVHAHERNLPSHLGALRNGHCCLGVVGGKVGRSPGTASMSSCRREPGCVPAANSFGMPLINALGAGRPPLKRPHCGPMIVWLAVSHGRLGHLPSKPLPSLYINLMLPHPLSVGQQETYSGRSSIESLQGCQVPPPTPIVGGGVPY
jgi:hypothetical protein